MAEGLNGLIFVKIVFTMVYLERKIIDSAKTSVLKEPVWTIAFTRIVVGDLRFCLLDNQIDVH